MVSTAVDSAFLDDNRLLCVGFTAKLSELQPSTYPSPKKCGSLYHCEQRPICHTDFKPHYGPEQMTLSAIVVGRTNWTYDPGQSLDSFRASF